MEVFELQRALFATPFMLFELADSNLSVKLLGSNGIELAKLRAMLAKLKDWRRGDIWGCIGNGLIQGHYAMIFENTGAKLVRIEGKIKVTNENSMNSY